MRIVKNLGKWLRREKAPEQDLVRVVFTSSEQRANGTYDRSPEFSLDEGRETRPSRSLSLVSRDEDEPGAEDTRRQADRSQQMLSDRVIDQFEALPLAARIYGTHRKDTALTKDQRELLGALIHEDHTVTVLLTPEAQKTAHMARGFIAALASVGQVTSILNVTAPVLASAYAHYDSDTLGGQQASTLQETNSLAKTFTLDVINRAIEADASDIHLEIRNNESATVRFRIDGDLEEIQTHTRPAEIDIARTMAPILFQGDWADDRSRSNTQSSEIVNQHALVRIPRIRNIALRYQTILDKDGFDLVLRLLTYDGKKKTLLDLNEMGFEPDQIAMLVEALSRPYGASFLGGSTGAGKTTTMAGLMHADPLKKIRKRYTAEDPVEIDMEDVTQSPVQRAANDTSDGPFVEVLKAFLRGDPDLLMVGEIRERATASIMMQLSLTGHNVWATLHINRMFDALTRLTDPALGVAPAVLGSDNLLNLLNSQTLVKTLCPHCKMPVADGVKHGLISEDLVSTIEQFGVPRDGLFVANRNTSTNSNQCGNCGGKGEKGRTLCAEMTLVDDEMKDLIAIGRFDEVEKIYRRRRKSGIAEPGMEGKTMLDHAFLNATRGRICAARLDSIGSKTLAMELKARKYRGYLTDV